VEGGLKPKLEHYGTLNNLEKTRGLQVTIQVVTLKNTLCRITWKFYLFLIKLKSYILWVKLTTYKGVAPKPYIQNSTTWQSLKRCRKLTQIVRFMLKNEMIHNLCIPIPIGAPLILLHLKWINPTKKIVAHKLKLKIKL
jgi:hypothetical protein